MVRPRVIVLVVGGALAALALVALLVGRAGRPGVARTDGSAEQSAALAPVIPSGQPSDQPSRLDEASLPNRVAVQGRRESEQPRTSRGDGSVVAGEIFEERCDDADGDRVEAPRRSSGRVRYLPIGAVAGRTLIEQELVDVERFTSEPLPRGEWIVETRIPGFQPNVEFAETNDEGYDCHVALRRGIEFELDVRLPDGTPPARALFAFVRRDARDERAFGPRSEEVLRLPTCLWTPDDPRVCISVDDRERTTELILVAEPSGESPYDARELCRYVSSPIAVDPGTDAPILVQLRDACSLRITVDGPEKPVLELWRWVCAVRLDGCEGFDFEALVASSHYVSDWPPELLDRAEFDWHSASGRWNEVEVSNALYLLPGRWQVAAGWSGQPASTSRVIEIVPGVTDVALTVDQPATNDRVCARFIVDGQHVAEPIAEPLAFALVAAGGERARRDVGKSSVRGTGGRWFEREELLSAQREITEELAHAVPVHVVAWFTEAAIQRTAFISAPLGALTGELELEKLACPDIQVNVAHTSKRIVALDLFARLIEPHPATRLVQVAISKPIDPVVLHVLPGLSGHRVLSGRMLPGRWRFDVRLSRAPFVTLDPIEMDLYAGLQELSVTLPELFDVTVHAPRFEVGTPIELRRLATSSTAEGEDVEVDELLDARHRAKFESLPAGQYVVSGGPPSVPLPIVVPCGEVVY